MRNPLTFLFSFSSSDIGVYSLLSPNFIYLAVGYGKDDVVDVDVAEVVDEGSFRLSCFVNCFFF